MNKKRTRKKQMKQWSFWVIRTNDKKKHMIIQRLR